MTEREDLEHEERIRCRAHQLWEEEGRPDGRHDDHWERARQLVAIEENPKFGTVPINNEKLGPEGEPIEDARVLDNLGEFPTLTDQDEQKNPAR